MEEKGTPFEDVESPVVGPHGGRYGPAWSLQQTDPRWPPGTEAHKHLCRQDYSHSQPRSSLTPRCGRAGPASLETGRHRGDSGSPGPGQSPSASTHSPTSVSPSWRMGLERQETLNTHHRLPPVRWFSKCVAPGQHQQPRELPRSADSQAPPQTR